MSGYAAAAGGGGGGGAGWRPPFTASQWQELEHQALIFKYLAAGVPVPQELLLPILKSFETMATRFYHHPTMGYCSLYGKKLDPEPWRCRRTDGKKWRCSKNAYPDSKYCERHMHRGRNRSRKPVETPTTLSQPSQPPTSSPSSTVTTLTPSGGGAAGMAAAAKSSPSTGTGIPLQSLGGGSAAQVSVAGPSGLGQLQIVPGYYQMAGGGGSRYLLGARSEVDEHGGFLPEPSGGLRGVEASPQLDNPPWQLLVPSNSYPLTQTAGHVSAPHGGGPPPPRPPSMEDFDHEASSSLVSARQRQKKQQQHYCFFGGEFGECRAPMKQQQQQQEGGQPLRSLFDEWRPHTRDPWSEDPGEDDRSNSSASLSTTQLSISMPVASSSDFSAASSWPSDPTGGAA